ncbi:MAG TPA: imidazole glycerol phosphate synthase subunit HisH [Fluviicola sp.]|nr:imidazole glycerol phosphate synthase subunit HisH [Fluviicola sp.]
MGAVVIDYGMGNVASVQKALRFLQIDSVVSNDKTIIREASALILPGVGAFAQGMHNLHESGLVGVLHEEVLQNKKPFLGICLGMQLLATTGTEPHTCQGLGWVAGTVRKMEDSVLRIPHLGWNTVERTRESDIIQQDKTDCYFIHSYHFDAEDPNVVLATVDYGKTYVAAIEQNNIFATQFHPEKSQDAGLAMLKQFFQKYA